ncbi:MAG: hypothetical protein QMD09_10825 [Desulfatibacillaceae bacterium]|nr:hypothetical protein [Desulfatibacillaceae bacterium]
MYKILQTSWGFLLTFGGRMDPNEMMRWFAASKTALEKAGKPFGVIVDMRTLELLGKQARQIMVNAQRYYREHGMNRSAVIVNSSLTNMQFQRIASHSSIRETERYFDEWEQSDWWQLAEDWVIRGIEPPKSVSLFPLVHDDSQDKTS